MCDNDLPIDFLVEPTQESPALPTSSKNSTPVSIPVTTKVKRKKGRKVTVSPTASEESSSSSDSDERRHRKRSKKKKKTPKCSSPTVTRRVVVASSSNACTCDCTEQLPLIISSLTKIKEFLRSNYCSTCRKAGHNEDTCRRRRPSRTLDLD